MVNCSEARRSVMSFWQHDFQWLAMGVKSCFEGETVILGWNMISESTGRGLGSIVCTSEGVSRVLGHLMVLESI